MEETLFSFTHQSFLCQQRKKGNTRQRDNWPKILKMLHSTTETSWYVPQKKAIAVCFRKFKLEGLKK